MSESSGILALFQAGGWVMYPLLAFSLFSWAVILERLWTLSKQNLKLQLFFADASNLVLQKNEQALQLICKREAHLPSARCIEVLLDRKKTSAHWKNAVHRQRLIENLNFRKNLWVLATTAAAAPFIGLFGTVVGILKSFGEMAKTGAGGFSVVAGGISEALVATAAGIIVAVIAAIAYNVLQARISKMILLFKLQLEELIELVEEKNM